MIWPQIRYVIGLQLLRVAVRIIPPPWHGVYAIYMREAIRADVKREFGVDLGREK